MCVWRGCVCVCVCACCMCVRDKDLSVCVWLLSVYCTLSICCTVRSCVGALGFPVSVSSFRWLLYTGPHFETLMMVMRQRLWQQRHPRLHFVLKRDNETTARGWLCGAERSMQLWGRQIFSGMNCLHFSLVSGDCCAGRSRERAADRLDKFIFHVHKFSLLGMIHF